VAEAAAEVVDSEVLAARSSATIARKKAICLGSAHKVVAAVADALSAVAAVAAVATATIAKNPVTSPGNVPRVAREDTVVDAAAAVADMAAAVTAAVVAAAAVAAAATRSVIDVKATVTWHATARIDCRVSFHSQLSVSSLLFFAFFSSYYVPRL